MNRNWIAAGAVNAFLCVAIGAFGAHALQLTERLAATYDTGVQYQMFHTIGLLTVGLMGERFGDPKLLHWAGWLFAAGIVLFSGSLYLLAVTGISMLGAITPLGGFCFLGGWALVAAAVLRKTGPASEQK